MRFFTRPAASMVDAASALPGRERAIDVPARHEVLGTPLQGPFPEGIEQAVFGMGCFWGAERIFWQADGVYTTAVGYAGGFTPNPTYEEVCSGRTGHAEVVLVAFDTAATSFEEMLKLFWEGHDPTQGMRQGNDVGTQYRSAILWQDEAQRAAARGLARGLPADARAQPATARSPPRSQHARPGPPLLLRRGLPPAVPREEPRRLLRARRHRRELPGRPGASYSIRRPGGSSSFGTGGRSRRSTPRGWAGLDPGQERDPSGTPQRPRPRRSGAADLVG